MIENIKANFTESIQTKIAASEMLPAAIEKAANMMVEALQRATSPVFPPHCEAVPIKDGATCSSIEARAT